MSKTSDRVDGIAFDMYRGRFTGTIDLEDTEAQAAATGETLVMVVIATVDGFQAKLDKEGDLARIAVLKATDARVLAEPELRDLMIERLGLSYGEVTPVPVQPGELSSKIQPRVSPEVDREMLGDPSLFPGASDEDEEETGEIGGFSDDDVQLSFGGFDDYSGVVGMVGSGQERWRSIPDG